MGKRFLLVVSFAVAITMATSCAAATTPTVAPTKPAATATRAPAAAPTATRPAATPTAAPTPTPKSFGKVTIREDYVTPTTWRAPFWVALEKGWYKEEGMEVEILPGQAPAVALSMITEKKEYFLMQSGGTMIQAREQGQKLKMVAGFAQNSDNVVITWKGEGAKKIETVKDLEGKKIAGFPGGWGETLFPAFCEAAKINCTGVMVNIEAAQKVPITLSGQVDGMITPYSGVAYMTVTGKPTTVFWYGDYGLFSYGLGVIAHEDTLKEKPDMVRAFLKASVRGFEYCEKNQEECVDIMLKRHPGGSGADKKTQMEVIRYAYSDMAHTKNTKGKPYGWMELKDWQAAQEAGKKANLIKGTEDAASYFTNDFLPK